MLRVHRASMVVVIAALFSSQLEGAEVRVDRERNVFEVKLTHQEIEAASIAAVLTAQECPNEVTALIAAGARAVATIDSISGKKGVSLAGVLAPPTVISITPTGASAYQTLRDASPLLRRYLSGGAELIRQFSDRLSDDEKHARKQIDVWLGHRNSKKDAEEQKVGWIEVARQPDFTCSALISMVPNTEQSVVLITHRGFLSIGPEGVTAFCADVNRRHDDRRTEFTVSTNDDGTVSFFSEKSHHWAALEMRDGRPHLNFDRDRIGAWEKFRINSIGNGEVYIQTARDDAEFKGEYLRFR